MKILFQGKLKWKDFNIKEQANGTGKAIIRTFNAMVTENTLDIRLYWAGKGTTFIPDKGSYGPLISAISVSHGKCHVIPHQPCTQILPPVMLTVLQLLVFLWIRMLNQVMLNDPLSDVI